MAKRRNFHRAAPRERGPRINHQITAEKVRVVGDGDGIEVLDLKQALLKAQSMGLDLVEVSPDQNPPVCKIIDFGKYKFEQQKKKKEQAKNQHTISIKEIKLRPKIGQHDYEIKRDHAQGFLEKGDKVKVSLRFRGREITHPEIGMDLMKKISTELEKVSTIETPAKFEGRQIIMVLAPKPGQKKKVEQKKPETDKKDKKELASTGGQENDASS